MKHDSFRHGSFASGDIGALLFVVVVVVIIMGLEFSFGYNTFMEKFNNSQLPEDEVPKVDNRNTSWWDGVVSFFVSVGETVTSAIQGFINVLGIFWDLMTFNIEAVEGFPVVIRILLSVPIWFGFFYMGAKIIRGF